MFQAVPSLFPIYEKLGGTFVVPRNSTVRAIRSVYKDVSIVGGINLTPFVNPSYKILEKADLIITGAPYKNVLRPFHGKKYMVFHGTYAYMGLTEYKRISHFDLICAIGPRMMDALKAAGAGDKVIVSGYLPFINFPSRDKVNKENFLNLLRLDKSKKTIAYLPWGDPYGSWNLFARKLIEETPSSFNLILRPHPSQGLSMRFSDLLEFMHIKKLVSRRENTFLDLSTQSLSSIYANVDMIISDGTSPAEESLFYDIPQIIIESKRFSRKNVEERLINEGLTNKHINNILRLYSCGDIITPEVNNFQKILNEAFMKSDKYKSNRNNYFEYVFCDRSLHSQNSFITSLKNFIN